MCIGGPKAPDTSRQEAEAARQREIENQRYTDQLAENKRQSEAQRADQQRQADEQKALLSEQLRLQQEALNRATQQQSSAERAAASRAEAERRAKEAAAAKRAADATAYSEGRSQRINQVTGDINAAYGGFDDSYFDQFAKDYAAYYTPQIGTQYKDASDQIVFKYADQGGLNGSAALKDQARLREKRRQLEGKVANDAYTAAGGFRTDIDSQRRALLGDALNAINIGPEILPEGVEDVNSQLQDISARLANFSTLAKQRAGGVSRPVFSDLGNAFGNMAAAGSSNAGATGSYDFSTEGLYQPKAGSAVRIVA